MKNIAYIETLSWGLKFLHRSEKRYGLFHFIIPVKIPITKIVINAKIIKAGIDAMAQLTMKVTID